MKPPLAAIFHLSAFPLTYLLRFIDQMKEIGIFVSFFVYVCALVAGKWKRCCQEQIVLWQIDVQAYIFWMKLDNNLLANADCGRLLL